MRVSKRFVFVLVAMMMTLGNFGLPSTAIAEEASGKECLAQRPSAAGRACLDPEEHFADIMSGTDDGFVTIADDDIEGNEAALYCVEGFVATATVPDPRAQGVITFFAEPGVITCDMASFARDFPGAELVVNDNMRSGWVIDSDEPVASMCWRGARFDVKPVAVGLTEPEATMDIDCVVGA